MSNFAGYYLWPTVWIDSPPDDTVPGSFNIEVVGDSVHSTELSVGIKVRVQRQGLFLFDFSEWAPDPSPDGKGQPLDFDSIATVALKRTAFLNAHLTCLYTALARCQAQSLEKMVLAPSDLITSLDLKPTGMSFGDQRILALAMSSFRTTYPQGLPDVSDWRVVNRRLTISNETLDRSFSMVEQMAINPEHISLCDLYLRSCKAHEDHNYSLGLMLAWGVTEKLLSKLWQGFVAPKRKQQLFKGDNYSVAVVTEMLSLTEQIPPSLYQEITRIRAVRNHWIHGLKPVSRQTGEAAVRLCEKVMQLTEGVDVAAPLVSHLHG